jgi:BlaI family transcriptional regulator, penicillinase repressor
VERSEREREAIFTERELDVMDILWRRGSGTVGEVQEQLSDSLAYTTVLTILRTLEEKGFVGHEPEGRAYRYHPLVEREQAQESHVQRLLRKLFSGSPELLMTQLVADRDIPRDELERLRKLLDERLG